MISSRQGRSLQFKEETSELSTDIEPQESPPNNNNPSSVLYREQKQDLGDRGDESSPVNSMGDDTDSNQLQVSLQEHELHAEEMARMEKMLNKILEENQTLKLSLSQKQAEEDKNYHVDDLKVGELKEELKEEENHKISELVSENQKLVLEIEHLKTRHENIVQEESIKLYKALREVENLKLEQLKQSELGAKPGTEDQSSSLSLVASLRRGNHKLSQELKLSKKSETLMRTNLSLLKEENKSLQLESFNNQKAQSTNGRIKQLERENKILIESQKDLLSLNKKANQQIYEISSSSNTSPSSSSLSSEKQKLLHQRALDRKDDSAVKKSNEPRANNNKSSKNNDVNNRNQNIKNQNKEKKRRKQINLELNQLCDILENSIYTMNKLSQQQQEKAQRDPNSKLFDLMLLNQQQQQRVAAQEQSNSVLHELTEQKYQMKLASMEQKLFKLQSYIQKKRKSKSSSKNTKTNKDRFHLLLKRLSLVEQDNADLAKENASLMYTLNRYTSK